MRLHKCDIHGWFARKYYFGSSGKLNSNFKIVREQIKDHKCDICGKLFSQSSNLLRHVKNIGYKCPYTCGELFGNLLSLKKHIKSLHEKNNDSFFTDHQEKGLRDFFEKDKYPLVKDLEYLSQILDISSHKVGIWFQKARQDLYKNRQQLSLPEQHVKIEENQQSPASQEESTSGLLNIDLAREKFHRPDIDLDSSCTIFEQENFGLKIFNASHSSNDQKINHKCNFCAVLFGSYSKKTFSFDACYLP